LDSNTVYEGSVLGSLLLEWWAEEGRRYPLRETMDPYAVLVDKIMLKEDQLETGHQGVS
jgi:adenine-specific DNA glycosylase